MAATQKRNFFLLLALSILVIIIFSLPNSRASENIQMVQVFEPDEAVPMPYLLPMIAPAGTVEQALRQFVFYEYYYYGFPHFGYSAILLLPLKWLGKLNDTPAVMLMLRQGSSVLLILAGILLLVYLQDRFKTYRSFVLFSLLIGIPAVVYNNFWWHPDGMVVLLAALILFFLQRDDLRLGKNFLFAAVLCGILTAVKTIGAYFFLAVGLALLLSLITRKSSLRRAAGMALAFLLVMGVSYIIANPFLLSPWGRTAFINIFHKQTDLLFNGYGIVYEKGLIASWPLVRQNYGGAIFLLIATATTLWGVWRSDKKLLFAFILAWFLPVSVLVFYFTHFKFQYWLPAALPLISTVAVLMPEKLKDFRPFRWEKIVQFGALLLVFIQMALFYQTDVQDIVARYHRADNEPSIQFYDQALDTLEPLQGQALKVYYDARMYVPETTGWSTVSTYDLLEYGYISENNFDVLLLMEQRIRDYLNPNAVGIDADTFKRNQQFYRDADLESVNGYHLVFRNTFGLIFVRDDYAGLFTK